MLMKPMLAKDSPEKPPRVPEGPGWTQEPKLDGWRFMWEVTEHGIRAYGGRNGADHSNQAPKVEAALAHLPVGTILDSELVAEGQRAPKVGSVLADPSKGRLRTYLFDVLMHDGKELIREPWEARRGHLERIGVSLDPTYAVIVPSITPSQEVHQAWLDAGVEGSVVKRVSSPYLPGKRSPAWIKLKPQQTAEGVVTGFKEGTGSNAGRYSSFRAVLLDQREVEFTTGISGNQAFMAEVNEDPDTYLGKVFEFKHHGLCPVPKSPIFQRMRPDRDPA